MARRQYRRGCQARTTKGKRCGNWAIKGSERRFGRALCSVHAGQAGASATKRCQAQTRAAKRCRNRALAHSKARYGRWLCIFHAAGGLASRPGPQTVVQGKLRCTARTASGRRCRKWALADGSWPGRAPLCALHAGRDHSQPVRHGYYSQRPSLSAQERAAIARALEEGEPLAAEVLLVRFKLRRLMRYLKREDLPAWRREAAARALFRGLGAVTRLMQARHNLARVRWGPSSGGYAQVQLANLMEEEEE